MCVNRSVSCPNMPDFGLNVLQQDLVNAAATTLSIMNTQLKTLGDAAPSAETLDRMAQIVYTGQTVVAPAAKQLAAGSLSLKEWTAAYGTAEALDAVYAKAAKVRRLLRTAVTDSTKVHGGINPVLLIPCKTILHSALLNWNLTDGRGRKDGRLLSTTSP